MPLCSFAERPRSFLKPPPLHQGISLHAEHFQNSRGIFRRSPMFRVRFRFGCISIIAWSILSTPLWADQPPKVSLLRVQKCGENTYFHVRVASPDDMHVQSIQAGPYAEAQRRELALTPLLAPQDAVSSAVYQRLKLPHLRPDVDFQDREKSQRPVADAAVSAVD